jgi:hypothetical protein
MSQTVNIAYFNRRHFLLCASLALSMIYVPNKNHKYYLYSLTRGYNG